LELELYAQAKEKEGTAIEDEFELLASGRDKFAV
jgi:hypothetical protein